MVKKFNAWFVVSLVLALFAGTTISAQSRFSTVVEVGENVITRYQLDQRTLFLSLLGAPGDPRELAKEQLINETLQVSTARAAGITASPDEVLAGSNEFAGRANLTAGEFLEALAANGIQAETFRDFIGAGVAWRTYVRDVLGQSARDIPDSMINHRLAESGTEGGVRVLVSEVLLPAQTPENKRVSRARASEISALTSEEEFAAAARELSIAPSAAGGGALNWIALSDLPPNIQALLRRLTPGQISQPVEIENAIGVFLLRNIEDVPAGTPENISIDYAVFQPEGDVGRVRQEVDACDDLFGLALGLPEDRLIRETEPFSALPADVRAELASLDPNEISTNLIRNGRPAVLMLCERTPALESTVDRNIIGNQILNIRLGTLAADHLTQIRANTRVVDLTR